MAFIISIPAGSATSLNAFISGSSNPKIYLKLTTYSSRKVGEDDGTNESEGIAVGVAVGLRDGALLGLNEMLGRTEGCEVSVGGEDTTLGDFEGSLLGSTLGVKVGVDDGIPDGKCDGSFDG